MAQPCLKRIDSECFKAQPRWAKQAFAYRLLHTLAPPQVTRRLPRILRLALLAPGVEVPPGVELPSGTVAAPGTTIPPGWTPADPLPPGVYQFARPPAGSEEYGNSSPLFLGLFEGGPAHRQLGGAVVTLARIIATSNDGYVRRLAVGTWPAVRNALIGTGFNSTDWAHEQAITGEEFAGFWHIVRSFLTFDLATIPTGITVSAVSLDVRSRYAAASSVSVQQGTHAFPLGLHHYGAFTGSEFAYVSWVPVTHRIFNFNAAGIAYVQANLGGDVHFCLRERDHDYLDVQPPVSPPRFLNSLYFTETIYADRRPALNILY